MMLSSPLQTSSSTMIDDRSLRAYLQQNSTWNLEESESMDQFHLPSEMRSINLNQMVSNIVEENSEYQQHEMLPMFVQHQTTWNNSGQTDQRYGQQMRNIPTRQIKRHSSSLSESGHPRNIPDLSSTHYNSPKDIQVLIRKGDHTGINSLIRNVSLQQFRQMIGLQRSSGLTAIHDRKNRYQQSSATNIRLINAFKQQEYQKLNQQRNSSIISMSSHETMNEANLTSPVTICQEISYFRSNRRTGVANTLHIAIEKCYEQLNYIRDSYAETESKIGIQMLHKTSSLINDKTNTNLSNNPSRVDRLIAEYHYEYNRIIRLHERIHQDLSIQDIEATGQTLDEWLNAINIVQDRRREEIDNATEKCRSGDARLSDEKDVLQLADALRILRITTRKIRTVLWYWLYWSTNSPGNKIPLIAHHQDELNQYCFYDRIYSSINNDLFDISESDEQRRILLKKKSILLNENNKENEYNE